MRHFVLAVIATVMLAGTAHAAHTPLDISKVVSQQEQIRADVMARKGRYKDMPSATRDELLSKQHKLLEMLDGKKTPGDLTEDQRMSAFNTLEWIEAAINNDQDERMVCTRERTVGSNRITRVCRTESQMKEARERARDQMLSSGRACGDLTCSGG